jgi:dienelactone hydrolase
VKRILLSLLLVFSLRSFADGPGDNAVDKVRPVPPPGAKISDADRDELEKGTLELGRQIADLRKENKRAINDLLSDVEIYHYALHYALKYNEVFHATNDVRAAKELIRHGLDRAAALHEGKAPWTNATGLVVRGYVSKIDGSVQPYGLIVPPGVAGDPSQPRRVDAWFHGRGETLSELNFLSQRERSIGDFAPNNAFVLHLYGRYCNANKFAGEIDLFEALDDLKKRYSIDENRIVVRGFSMGGAACWQFAVHYAGRWVAAAPGAGFAETAQFLNVFQNEAVQPPWWEKKLWHMYDSTDYAVNLFNCPTVAYSGEIDRQKQAADVMAKALAEEGLELTHIIGPKTAHAYEPVAKQEVSRRIDSIAAKGRNPVPEKIRFTTWTLRYNEMLWVTIDGMEEHWGRARVDADIIGNAKIQAKTKNVSAISFSMSSGYCPFDPATAPTIEIDGQSLHANKAETDRSWTAHFVKQNGKWGSAAHMDDSELRKRHGLQGPIDDAFMDSFVMVEPTGQPMNEAVGKWAAAEEQHAIEHWRKQFRGEAKVVKDTDVTDELIAKSNLVLWGDPESNAVLKRIADKLQIHWNKNSLSTGEKNFPVDKHVPVFIYPNPLNPKKYVVVNSGFTFREYDYLNNARQISKLPDWAIIDISQPVTSRYPGKVVTAGFFDEHWQFKKEQQL